MKVDELLKLHDDTTAACRAIMERKNSDYTGGETATDALANFKTATALGLHPVTGLLLRMQDKLMRVRSFVADGKLRVTGETVEDACDDMVNYAILCKALLREEAASVAGETPEYRDADEVDFAWITDRLPTAEDADKYGRVSIPCYRPDGSETTMYKSYRCVTSGSPWHRANVTLEWLVGGKLPPF